MKILEKIYIISKIIRFSLIFSVFGVVSACKHNPPCGQYFITTVKEQGFLSGLKKGIPRIITCY